MIDIDETYRKVILIYVKQYKNYDSEDDRKPIKRLIEMLVAHHHDLKFTELVCEHIMWKGGEEHLAVNRYYENGRETRIVTIDIKKGEFLYELNRKPTKPSRSVTQMDQR